LVDDVADIDFRTFSLVYGARSLNVTW
jgi:hypothetical protein